MDTWCLTIYMPVMMMVYASSMQDGPMFWGAQIFGTSTVAAGKDLQLKCNAFSKQESSGQIHMYLCKDGVGVMMEPLGKKDDHVFTLRNVSVVDSANYSCVYSLNKYPPKKVNASGKNSVYVQVICSEKLAQTLKREPSFDDMCEYTTIPDSGGVTPTNPKENFVVHHLGVALLFLLVGILLLGMCHITKRRFKKFFQNQGQSEQDNIGHEGSEKLTQTLKREPPFDDMCEYTTIPDSGVDTGSDTFCYIETGVYSLAQGTAVYSLANHADMKTDTEQPTTLATAYAKVQSVKFDEFTM